MGDFTDRSQFRVGDLLVVPGRLIVVCDGQEIKLEPRWMQVLVMLAEHAGETLSTKRLLIEVWGSTVYDDSPVLKAISRLRMSIGDDSRNPRYIETVSKTGYRLIALVSFPQTWGRI
jgi:DNA-binding winged helix-turn-helix (wHTH) protein